MTRQIHKSQTRV